MKTPPIPTLDADYAMRSLCDTVASIAKRNNVDELRKVVAFCPAVFGLPIPEGGPPVTQSTKYPRPEAPPHSLLHQCCTMNEVRAETLRFILENGGEAMINTPDARGRTPIFCAKEYLQHAYLAVDILKAFGGDDSLAALKHCTGLHFAARQEAAGRHEGILKARLASHPQEMFMRDAEGYTPLDYISGPPDHIHHIPILIAPGCKVAEAFKSYLEAGLLTHPGQEGAWRPKNPLIYNHIVLYDLLPELFRTDRWQGREENALTLYEEMDKHLQERPYPPGVEALRGIPKAFESARLNHDTLLPKFVEFDMTPIQRAIEARANQARPHTFAQALKRNLPDTPAKGKR